MANKKVSVYTRNRGENFRAAPAVPDLNAIYYLRFYDGPRQRWQRVGQYDFVKRAKLLLERQLSAKAQGFTVPDTRTPGAECTSLRDALTTYLADVEAHKHRHTFTGYKQTLDQFVPAVNADYLDEVKRAQLLEFITWLRKEGYSDRTVYNKTENVVTFLKASGLPSTLGKTDWPKYEEKKATIYSNKEVAALRAAATDEELDVLESFLGSGFRKGELANLRWTDVDFPNRLIRAQAKANWKTKDGEQRVIPLHARLLARLEARHAVRKSNLYVFPNRNGGPNDHLDRVIATVAARAGVNLSGKRLVHDLRKTWATRLTRNGVDVVTVKELLGHSSMDTTMSYLKAVDPDDPRLVAQITCAVGGD
jgi:integrase